MNVPCRLVFRETLAARPDAHLLPTQNLHDLVAFLSHCQRPDSIAVFPVAGGFLIETRGQSGEESSGTIRLRNVAGDAYVPLNAELVPPLLDEEWEVLTKSQGLIFLPGNERLAFDRSQPLSPDRWLSVNRITRNSWQPFPQNEQFPDRLFRIEWPSPPNAAVEILSEGQPDGADPLKSGPEGNGAMPEDVRPPGSGIGAGIMGYLGYASAKLFATAGNIFRAPFLVKMGAAMARKSIERMPRISEKLLGAQEAALREILRQLKSGNVEKYLRKAPIAVADPDRPGTIDSGSQLNDRDTRFSLRDLISGGDGPATIWLGGGDVWAQLAQEYRRLALEAIRNGDYRRAAYLYGVLLRDIHSAASALEQGGFFRDAAILYRDKTRNFIKAAATFDRAGDHDEAIRLYEQQEHFEWAGDIARRIGDDHRARELYHKAAEKLAASGRFLAAGMLARKKWGSHDHAMSYFHRGWTSGQVESLVCGTWYYVGLLGERDWSAADRFLDEAETVLAPPNSRDAEAFFNQILRAVHGVVPKEYHEDLIDRTKLFFARHLRESNAKSKFARDLFGNGNPWPAPFVRDAIFATSVTPSTRIAPAFQAKEMVVAQGTVLHTAVCQLTRDIVIATTEQLVIWRPDSDRKVVVAKTMTENVLGISVNGNGTCLLILLEDRNALFLRFYAKKDHHRFEMENELLVRANDQWESAYLPPDFELSDREFGIYDFFLDDVCYRVRLKGLLLYPDHDPVVVSDVSLLVNGEGNCVWQWSDRELTYQRLFNQQNEERNLGNPGWRPQITTSNYRLLDWLTPAYNIVQFVGVDCDENLHWTIGTSDHLLINPIRSVSSTKSGGYRAACLLAPGLIAAATNPCTIHWLKQYGIVLSQWAKPIALQLSANLFSLIARPAANEVIAVLTNGTVLRIPFPNHHE